MMKKNKKAFMSGFIAICFSFCITAQSSDKDLDQVELMKQFTGTWVTELDEDGTVVWEIIPLGKGYEQNLIWKSGGEITRTDKGIIGFTGDGVEMIFLWSQDGVVSRDYGKFKSEDRIFFERFDIEHTHVYATFDFNFVSPKKVNMIWKSRGTEQSWDNARVSEWIWIKQ